MAQWGIKGNSLNVASARRSDRSSAVAFTSSCACTHFAQQILPLGKTPFDPSQGTNCLVIVFYVFDCSNGKEFNLRVVGEITRGELKHLWSDASETVWDCSSLFLH